MAKKKREEEIPILKVPKNATMKEIYAAARAQFTAADLQVFTEIDDDYVTGDEFLRSMERVHREATRQRDKKKKKNG